MAFIHTIPEDEAAGAAAELYERSRRKRGYVPNYTKLLSLRPEVMAAWSGLQDSIRRPMSPRRWELITLTAAAALECTY